MAFVRENRCKVEVAVEANLLQQIHPTDRSFKAGQTKLREQSPKVRRKLMEEHDHVLWLAAELRAQLRPLGSDAGGTGVEVALPRHIAAEGDEYRSAEGVFISTQECRN